MSQTFGENDKKDNGNTQQETAAQSSAPRVRTSIQRSFMRDPAEEMPTQLVDAFQKAIEKSGERGTTWRVGQVNTSEGVRLPIVYLSTKLGKTVYAHGFVLWTGQQIPDWQDPQTNERIPRTVNDVCDEITASKLVDRVRRDAGVAGSEVNVTLSGLTPISVEVSHDNEQQIADLLFIAGNAIETCAESLKDLPADTTTLDTLRQAQSRLEAQVSYGNPNSVSMLGIPRRADIRIGVIQTTGKQNSNSLHNSDEMLTELEGFVDFSYAPQQMVHDAMRQAAATMPLPGQPAPRVNRRFIGTFVVTNLDYLPAGVTLASKLFAFASLAAVLRAPYQWAESFRNTYGSSNVLRNIGGLARECPWLTDSKATHNTVPPGKAINALSSNFKRENLYDLVEDLVFPDLAIAMDVDEGGEWSWLDTLFINAAGVNDRNGNTSKSQQATAAIVRELNTLTNGRFSQYFPQSARLFLPTTFRMHRGYFELTDKGRMDIRELGMLELMNSGTDKQSYENAVKYALTFEDSSLPEHVSQKQRLEIFKETLGGGEQLVKVLGHTRRLYWSAEAIGAIVKSFQQSGLSFTADQVHISTGQSQRGAQYLNGAIIAPNLGMGMVHSGGSQGPAAVSYQSPTATTGLWG